MQAEFASEVQNIAAIATANGAIHHKPLLCNIMV